MGNGNALPEAEPWAVEGLNERPQVPSTVPVDRSNPADVAVGARRIVHAKLRRRFWWLWGLSLLVVSVVVWRSGAELRYVDEREYMQLARHLIHGEGFVNESAQATAFRPPGYPFWLAPWAWLDTAVQVGKALNVALLGLTMLFMRDLVARRVPGAAWCAGLAPLAYPVWAYTAGTLYPQTLCLAMLMGVLWYLDRRDLRVSPGGSLVLGAVWGALVLIAPSFLMLTPVLVWMVVSARGGLWARAGTIRGAMLTLGVMLVLSPWAWRNWQVFGELVPVSTNGGVNLALGNSPVSSANSGTFVDMSYFTRHIPPGSSELVESHIYRQLAVDWMQQEPLAALSLYVAKWLNYFNFRASMVGGGQSGWTLTASDWVVLLTYYPLIGLVAARLIWLRKLPLSRTEWMLGLMYVGNAFVAAIFFTRLRFRLPFDGVLMTWALISLGQLVSAREGRWRATAA